MSFNWEVYRDLNPDLIRAGLRTQQQYERHYVMYGRREGRKFNNDIKILILFMCNEYFIGCDRFHNILDKSKYSITLQNNHFMVNENLLRAYDIIICGSFMPDYMSRLIHKYAYKTILYISEPIEFFSIQTYNLYIKNVFKGYVGAVPQGHNSIKYPLYVDIGDIDECANLNNISKEQLLSKEFCILINRHDKGGTRVPIYNKLLQFGKIVCPSNLLNNFSNAEFENIGRTGFQSRFIFNICPENFVTSIDGYVTEKLMYACVSGNIPIYYGKLDDIDKRIFNLDRILWYDPTSMASINNLVERIGEMMNDKDKLYEFYRRDIFMSSAKDTIADLKNDYNIKFHSMLA
jgi:hypothetical protein